MLDASVSHRPEYGGQQTCRDADHRDLKVAPNGIKTTILDVEQPGYFLPTMHSAPRQPSRRVKQTTALHCQRLRIAFISPLFTLSYAKLFFIVCCTNNSVNGDDLAFRGFRIPNEASECERRGI